MKHILASLVVAFSASACATQSTTALADDAAEASIDVEAGSDALATAAKSCGAKYKPAQQKYELAVAAAKAMLGKDVCGETTHPINQSMVAMNTTEDVESFLLGAINDCGYFRTVYNTSPYAKPARTVLQASAMRGIIEGTVNPKTFAGLQAKLAGATIYGPKPGVMNTMLVSFLAGNRAVFSTPNWDNGERDKEFYSYEVLGGATPKLHFFNEQGELFYNIRHVKGSSLIEFVVDGENEAALSSYSSPCDA